MRAFFICAALLAAAPAAAAEIRLGRPVACQPGRDCWIQQYMDHDPSSAVRDYACRAQTYDGHDGTDIRIRDTTSRVAVIAAAGGTVTATRDGVANHLMKTEADRTAVGDRECGNGVLIDHGGGWETQYCHLRRGSLAVSLGDRVTAGQRLGEVGYSGMAAFPHVHLAVRSGGKEIDPFLPSDNADCGPAGQTLWTDAAAQALVYRRGAILAAGFAPGPVHLPDLETGGASAGNVTPATDWGALVAYVWAINLEAGDELTVRLTGPSGMTAENSALLDRSKAQYLLFAGKKRPAGGWPKGPYEARIEVRNAGELRMNHSWVAVID